MWRPKTPPISFPSHRFMSMSETKNQNMPYDYQEDKNGPPLPYEDQRYGSESYGSESVSGDSRTYMSEGASVHSTNGRHQEL